MDRPQCLYDSFHIGSHQSQGCGIFHVTVPQASSLPVNYRDQARPNSGNHAVRLAPVKRARQLLSFSFYSSDVNKSWATYRNTKIDQNASAYEASAI